MCTKNVTTSRDSGLSELELNTIYTNLIKKGPEISGHSEVFTSPKDIPWFDPILVDNGMKFAQQNFLAIVFSGFLGGFFPVGGKNLGFESPFRKPGPGGWTADHFFHRIVSTLSKGLKWMESNIGDETSEGFKTLKNVRKLHNLYGEPKEDGPIPDPIFQATFTQETDTLTAFIRRDIRESGIDISQSPEFLFGPRPPFVFSQFTMAMTQFSMVAPLVLFPDGVGLSVDASGLDGFFHIYALIGRALGLEDRFNLALTPDPRLYRKIMNNVVVASWSRIENIGTKTVEIFTQAVNQNFRLPSILKLETEFALCLILSGMGIGIGGSRIMGRIGVVNMFYYKVYKLFIWLSRFSRVGGWIVNYFYRHCVYKVLNHFGKTENTSTNRDYSKPQARDGCPF